MGHQIVKQPDGKLAIFSSFSDTWIVWDSTPEEIVEYYAERAAKDARESALDTVNRVMAGEERQVYYQFTETFARLNAKSKSMGGDVLPGPLDEEYYSEIVNWRDDDDPD